MVSTVQFKRGDTFSLVFEFNLADGTPANLEDYTARLQITPINKGNIVFSAVSETDDLIIIGTAGVIYLNVDYSKTKHLSTGAYSADLKVTSADGIRTSTETIIIQIIEDITV